MRKTTKAKTTAALIKRERERPTPTNAGPSAKVSTRRTRIPAASKSQVSASTAKTADRNSHRADPKSARTPNKLATVVAMLREKHGASIKRLIDATGWQAHSVRGAISGAIKKKLGFKVDSAPSPDGRVYRIVR